MSVLGWMTALGALLLFMALTSSQVKRLPISTAFIYLIVGVAIGPLGIRVLQLDINAQREWMETFTLCAVVVSLFVGGLKLRLPLRHRSWRPAFRLASVVMVLSIAGAAFPFVLLALEGLRIGTAGAWVGEWFVSRLLWAVPVGLAVGYLLGLGLGQFAIAVRSRQRDHGAPSDFLALALIALSYVAAERLHAYGFLAVFAAGVGLRHAEVRVVRITPHPGAAAGVRHWLRRAQRAGTATPAGITHPPAETLVSAHKHEEPLEQPAVAAGVLIAEALAFGDTIERLLEVLLVVLVGISLAQAWSPRAALLALVLFVLVRPASTVIMLHGTRTGVAQRGLMGWFGIRGIGSLYYVGYALNHGVNGPLAVTMVQIVVTVVATSIVLNGLSVTPILARYERSLSRAPVSRTTLSPSDCGSAHRIGVVKPCAGAA